MGLKEAIRRGPTEKGPNFRENYREVYNEYESLVESRGDELLEMASVPLLINELRDIVAVDHPDVRFFAGGPMNFSRDERGFRLEWNFRTPADAALNETEYDVIIITAQPSSNRLTILQGDGVEILTKDQWSMREVVEDAIVRAYQNPGVGKNKRISGR